MQHVLRDDPCRRATFGMTIENSTARLWFCCRSSVIVSEAFNFITVRVFYYFLPFQRRFILLILPQSNQIRSLKPSLNSLPLSPLPTGSHSALTPPFNAFRKTRKVLSLLFIRRMTRQTQGGIALRMSYLHTALNRFEVEAPAFSKPSRSRRMTLRKAQLSCWRIFGLIAIARGKAIFSLNCNPRQTLRIKNSWKSISLLPFATETFGRHQSFPMTLKVVSCGDWRSPQITFSNYSGNSWCSRNAKPPLGRKGFGQSAAFLFLIPTWNTHTRHTTVLSSRKRASP